MGRTGSLFSFQQYDVIPDVLVLGKALGGGMPMGAFLASRPIMNTLSDNPILGHITTFGGHPVACAAGHAAFNVLLEEKLMDTVSSKSELFKELLIHPKIKQVHGMGLLLAVELDSFDIVNACIQQMLDQNLFADWFLYAPHCLRICPPLTITNQEIELACTSILQILDKM
jgi:acetylornithine/succinyldiaminopimelate/putrescine aminotransferase